MPPTHRTNTVLAWAAIIPLTAALVWFYVSGWNAVAPTLIIVLGALTVSTELLKWSVLELAERRLKEGLPARAAALGLAALGCLVWGVVSGVVAIHALTAPSTARAEVAARVAAIEAQIDALPAPTADMPAKRIEAMSAETKLRRAELGERLAKAQAQLDAMPAAAPMPTIPIGAKVLVAILVEAICFGVPFALRSPAPTPARAPVQAPAQSGGNVINVARELANRRWGKRRAAA